MPGSLCIQVSSAKTADKQDIHFFEASEWTSETEKQLLSRMQELFSLVRNISEKFEIVVNVEVTDMATATFLLNKKRGTDIEINNQKLSLREIEVLDLIMQGNTNNEIAEKLFISYETVRSHRKNILEKTGAKNTAALINYYHQTFFEK